MSTIAEQAAPSLRLRALWESGEYQRLAMEHASVAAFAAAVGMSDDAIKRARKRLAGEGVVVPSYADMRLRAAPVPTLPPGHVLKGASTLVNAEGQVLQQWIKTREDVSNRNESMMEALASIADAWKGKADPVARPEILDADLMCAVPMGDPHLGLYSWAEETGESFDLEQAESNLVGAVDHLVGLAPRAAHGLLINLGDFFHADNSSNQTMRSHHALDVDTRWAKVLGVGVRTMRRCIDRMLERFGDVTVICAIGNHDDHSSVMLATCLSQFYERDPRVTINTSPSKFHWHRFGSNLLGVTHGDTCKIEKLPGIMACDRAVDWGETQHRYWYTGHVHHDRMLDAPGCVVESFRTLAARDAYAAGAGYRSGRDLKLDVLHRRYGRINRHTVGIQQVWERK